VTAIVLSFGVALGVNGAFFAVAAALRTDVVTDLSYSLTFALLAAVLPFTGAGKPRRSRQVPLSLSLAVAVPRRRAHAASCLPAKPPRVPASSL